MDKQQVGRRIAALRAEVAALGRELADGASGWPPEVCFEVAGELQGVVTAAEGAQGLVAAFGARVETTMTESGPWERTHPVGFVDAMAPAEMSLATGLTEGLAGRRVALGAALSQRFPLIRDLVLAGDLPQASAHKVVDACAGLDIDACERVDAQLAGRLPQMDPARVASETRRVAALPDERAPPRHQRHRQGIASASVTYEIRGDEGDGHRAAASPGKPALCKGMLLG